MFVNFISVNHSINIKILCNRSEKFSKVKEKLCQVHPELRYKNLNFYLPGCSLIKEFLTVGENKINDGEIIIIIEKE